MSLADKLSELEALFKGETEGGREGERERTSAELFIDESTTLVGNKWGQERHF